MDIPNSVEIVDTHLGEYFLDDEIFVLDEKVSEVIHSDVYVVKPSDDRPFYILMTCGLSALPMVIPDEFEADEFCELIMLLPSDWNMDPDGFDDENNWWPFRTLKELSKHPHINNTWLGYGHTFSSDEQYSDNCKFCGVILVNTTSFADEFMEIITPEKKVRLFSAIPLYKEEIEFKQKFGTTELMKKFEEFNIEEVVDINRPNVCGQ